MTERFLERHVKGILAQALLYLGIFLLAVATLTKYGGLALTSQLIIVLGLAGGFMTSSEYYQTTMSYPKVYYSLWLRYLKNRPWENSGDRQVRARAWITTLVATLLSAAAFDSGLNTRFFGIIMALVTFPAFFAWVYGFWARRLGIQS